VKKNKNTLAVIYWNDAWGSTSGWIEKTKIDHSPIPVITTGFLVNESKLGVTTAASMDEVGKFSGISFTPSNCITKIIKRKV